jgi:predicted O-linked N-acetylglucosamine transferase (SPINDLY family)
MTQMTVQQAIELALRHHTAGDLATAENIYRQILAVEPNNVDAWNNLGVALQQSRRWRDAEMAFRRALQLQPNFPNALGNLGECLRTQRRLGEAIDVLARSVQLDPENPDLQYNYGTALDDAKRHEEAIAALQKSIAIRPTYPLAFVNLAASLMARDRYSEGVEALEKAIELDPKNPMSVNNLAHAYLKTGEMDRAVETFYRAAELDGKRDMSYLSNYLLAMHYQAPIDPVRLFNAHVEFGKLAARQLPPVARPPVDKNPDRRLRIAYVSADFCRHSVAFFIEPILRHHDRSVFEVVCYNDTVAQDPVTQQLRPLPTYWRDTATLNDEELAQQVVADRIDIFVDLVGHTARNRMPTFARKPAPVQVSYLGYPNTTGLATMDWRITDAIADPPGQTESLHTERLFRLSRPAWCYQPAPQSPPIVPPPALQRGYVTFGCLNALMKMNEPLMRNWAEILAGVPTARMIIKTGALRDANARKRLHDALLRLGIDESRFDLLPPIENYADHLAVYNDIDIALDTFPYNGTTTTCDALWMGVPVLTEAGRTHVSRVSTSLLSAVGLSEWSTDSPPAYVARAIAAAADLAVLAELRSRLREAMKSSPIMDGAGLARELERAYRTMWREFCGAGAKTS